MKLFWLCCLLSLELWAARYDLAVESLRKLQQEHPRFSQIFKFGSNESGQEILAIRISAAPERMDPQKIGYFVVSTHHGDELKTVPFTLKFIKTLLKRYEGSELIRGQLAEIEWTIVPVLNITGYNRNNRYEYGLDPNRDYPSPCLSRPTGQLKSVRSVMDFFESRTIVGSVTVHGYQGSLTYPWGIKTDDHRTDDHDLYSKIVREAASVNHYLHGTAAEVVSPENGCYEDWVYWRHGTWSLLLELSSGSSGDIDATVPAIFKFFDQLNGSPSVEHDFHARCTARRTGFRIH